MSWLRIEGIAPSSRKIAPLSDCAFRLWVTASCWCAEHRTDGEIPDNIPETLPRAPQGKALRKAIQDLVDAGLWELTDAGWQVHNWSKWNLTKADYEAKAKAGGKGGRGRSTRKADAKQMPSKCLASAQAEPKQASSIRQADPDPDPDPEGIHTAAVDPSLSGHCHTPPGLRQRQQPVPSTKVPCPKAADLLTPEQRGTLEVAGIPGWATDAIVADFAARAAADPSDLRPLIAWRKCAARAVSGDWNDARRRPQKPDASGAVPIALKGGAVQRSGESFVAKFRAEQAAKAEIGAEA